VRNLLTCVRHFHISHAYAGIGQYDKIGLISNNRWEWAALAAASYSLNATIVPMCEFLMNRTTRMLSIDFELHFSPSNHH